MSIELEAIELFFTLPRIKFRVDHKPRKEQQLKQLIDS